MPSRTMRVRSSVWNSPNTRRPVCGCWRKKSPRRGVSQLMANEGEQLKVAVAASGGWRIWASVLSMASKLSRSTTASHLPSGVGTSARGVRARGAQQKRAAQPVFKLLDLLADRPLGDAQLGRRLGKAAMAGWCLQTAEPGQQGGGGG